MFNYFGEIKMLKHIFIFVVCISVTYARSQHTNGRIVGKLVYYDVGYYSIDVIRVIIM